MVEIFLSAILPLFSVILLGYFLNKKEVVSDEWASSANRVTYYIAIPSMIFRSIAGQDVKDIFSFPVVVTIIIPLIVGTFVGWIFGRYIFRLQNNARATFIHAGIHGNIGYLAFAISYYSLGDRDFPVVAAMSSILIIVQNIIGVIILSCYREEFSPSNMLSLVVRSIVKNPIVISVFLGVLVSALEFELPTYLARFIKILADMALPTGLLLVGAGFVFKEMRSFFKELIAITTIKLVLLPFTAFWIALLLELPKIFILPLLILFSSPTATVTYVMATQLGGHPTLASSSISIQTLLCAISYSFVISFFK